MGPQGWLLLLASDYVTCGCIRFILQLLVINTAQPIVDVTHD